MNVKRKKIKEGKRKEVEGRTRRGGLGMGVVGFGEFALDANFFGRAF